MCAAVKCHEAVGWDQPLWAQAHNIWGQASSLVGLCGEATLVPAYILPSFK